MERVEEAVLLAAERGLSASSMHADFAEVAVFAVVSEIAIVIVVHGRVVQATVRGVSVSVSVTVTVSACCSRGDFVVGLGAWFGVGFV